MELKFGKYIKDYHISDEFEGQRHRSKVKVKNVKIPVLGLVSEKAVLSQGHKGQSHKGQRSRQNVVAQGCRIKVKADGGLLYPIDFYNNCCIPKLSQKSWVVDSISHFSFDETSVLDLLGSPSLNAASHE